MKLIKINTDHYVIVDDSEIKKGDYFISDKIIHQAEEILDCDNDGNKEIHSENYCNPLILSKKITHSTQPNKGMENVTFISPREVKELIGEVDVEKKAERDRLDTGWEDSANLPYTSGFVRGYNQALEDNKEFIKKPTEWEVYFDENGKLKLV